MTVDVGKTLPREPTSVVALLTATALLLLAGSIELVAVAGFALGLPISSATLPLGALVAGLGTVAIARSGDPTGWRRSASRAIVSAIVIVAAAVVTAGLIHDTTYDGNWYHQPAVMALANGWNPVAGPPSGDAARAALLASYSEKTDGTTAATVITHYSKGAWYLAAALIRAGTRFEQSKAFNLILIVVAALTAFAAMRTLARWTVRRAALAAALVALNPVATCQAFTFYVDGQVGSILAALVAAGALAARAPDPAAMVAFGTATALALNLKFNGVAYAPVLVAAACFLAFRLRGPRSAAALGALAAVAFVVGGLAMGWNPYVTNTLTKRHPFYPITGPNALSVNLPRGFREMNRFERLAASVSSVSINGISAQISAQPKIPFRHSWHNFGLFGAPDVRLGGFGPLFSGALVIAAVLALASLASAPRSAAPWLLAAVSVLASTLVTKEGWWARFAPQLWLVPFAIGLAPVVGKPRVTAALRGLLLTVLAANALLVLAFNLRHKVSLERELRAELRALRAEPSGIDVRIKHFEGVRFRLAEAGVRFSVVDSLPCQAPETVAASDALWCPHAGGAIARP